MPGSQPTRKSLSQLLDMLDSIVEGIYCVNLEGECTYCNQRCLELLGFESESELLGQNMHDLIHHHHRDGSAYEVENCKIFLAYNNDLNVHVDDEIFFRKDGAPFDADYRSYPIKEDGKIVGAVVTFTDITLTQVETAQRNHLARLVDSSRDAIISKDLDGVITSWNQGAKEVYGYDAEEAIGRSPQLLLTDDRHEEEPEIQNAIRSGTELLQFQVRRKRKNGEICDLSVTISPLHDAANELIGYSSIERDITESRKSQDAILRAITAAERAESLANEANKSRTEFLANVSHELRTPMNAILGMLNLTLEEELDPLVIDYLTVAKTSADSLLELVDELLDFAKLESGKFEIFNEPFDVRATIDTPAKVLSSRASEKGVEILCEIDADIPSRLIGDDRRIQQVITNLLGNAVKFTNRGEIVVNVRQVRKLPSEVRLRFSVADTGVGIAPEDQESVLLPFEQADMSSTRKHHGTGLGLAICRELVALMGGQLNLESEPGKGSTFFFELSLPIAESATPAEQLPQELVKDLRVLIVDDNPTNLRILEKLFANWSMKPIISSSAEQALRILDEARQQDRDISLAIVDALMPQVDGYDLAERVAQREGDTPPIVMMQSAADLGLYADRKSKVDVAHYLTKPVSQSDLLDAVVDTLDLYSDPDFRTGLSKRGDRTSLPVQPLLILLVEDLPANQKVAQAILNKRGHKVVTAPNGRVAVDQVQSGDQDFDVILMDVQMPVMDGLQATAAIRALSDTEIAEIPIIAMTAHAMQGDREICLAAGMDAYIAKPLDAKRLIELTESIALDPIRSTERKPPKRKPLVPRANSSNSTQQNDSAMNESVLLEYENSVKRLGGDKELFVEFVEIFRDDAPLLLDEVAAAVEAGDAESLEKSAHALKGLMSNFGAMACCELALRFELAGRRKNVASVKGEMPELRRLFGRLCEELSEY